MPRKVAFSGKQKKKQLQEKKLKKQDGPSYLRDSDEDGSVVDVSSVTEPGTTQGTEGNATRHHDSKIIPEVQKINIQPGRKTGTKLDANRLHFFKEDVQSIKKGKREAQKPIKPVGQEYREWRREDVYPVDAKLDFPKRPPWKYSSSKQETESLEQQYFKAYVEDLLDQSRVQDLSLFELNLETWRQLWRVLEMSDILLVVADIRYPVLHVPSRLLDYVLHDLRKQAIVILNKVDFVTPALAMAWKKYLSDTFHGVHFIFFSSFPRETSSEHGVDPSSTIQKTRFQSKSLAVGPVSLYRIIKSMAGEDVDLSPWEQKLREDSVSDLDLKSPSENFTLDVDKKLPQGHKEGDITVGCIGYPNVGKSSVLNALMGKKVVSVSKTPGHTKHFQTIYLCPSVKLCDCPGLVFPSMVPKSLQVIAGIFPVSQVKEPYSVIGYLAKRLDLPRLLQIHPPQGTSPRQRGKGGADHLWSTYDICEAWAVKCGYTTSKAGRPDLYRAANKILRMAVDGQLCLCFFPPGFSTHNDEDVETKQLAETLKRHAMAGAGQIFSTEGDNQEEEDDGSEEESDSESEQLAAAGMFDQLSIEDSYQDEDET